MTKLGTILKLAAGGLFAAAIVQELRRPAATRTWHGELAGFVPYDLRPPTWERLKAAVWSPEDPRVLTSHAFGVGWSVNLARVSQLLGLTQLT